MADIIIRSVEKEDCARLAEIEKECFSVPWSEQSFFKAICMDNTVFLAAQAEAVIGYVGLYQSLEEGEITNVAVSGGFRGRKIGSALMRQLLLEAKERGITRIFLEVRESNKTAIALYCKYGFGVCGKRHGYYEKPKEDALLMKWEA